MDDYLDKLAELSDQIVDILDVDAETDPDEAFAKAESIQAELDDLTNNPPAPPEIEPPKEAPAQIEPPKDEIDPLAAIRGLTADEIDKLMNKQPMLDLIEQVTGDRPATRTKASDLAAMLEKLAV